MASSELERFVDEYAERAYGFALSLCGNEPDARELVQEAFVRLFDRFEGGQPMESWFFSVLRNLYVDGTRRFDRNKVSLDAPFGDGGLSVADALPDEREEALLSRLERQEDLERLREAIAALPAEPRAVLSMIDIQGMDYEAVARVLDCPIGTVRSRVSRARDALRERMLEEAIP